MHASRGERESARAYTSVASEQAANVQSTQG